MEEEEKKEKDREEEKITFIMVEEWVKLIWEKSLHCKWTHPILLR